MGQRPKGPRIPGAGLFAGPSGTWLLALSALGVVISVGAELPALTRMGAHGTNVFGLEFAGSPNRLAQIVAGWGSAGLHAAREHVLLDLGFIASYALLLAGSCGRVARRLTALHHTRAAAAAALLAWGGLLAAAINVLQKVLLWRELHGQISQPAPAIVALCSALTLALGLSAATFAAGAAILLRFHIPQPRSRPA
jgi:hypothetical protein